MSRLSVVWGNDTQRGSKGNVICVVNVNMGDAVMFLSINNGRSRK